MIEIISLTSLAIFTLYYLFFITRVQLGITKLIHNRRSQKIPFISIVIAARNEERNIGRCLNSVLQQSYPSSKYEVIIVDDHSTDGTLRKLQDLQKSFKNLKAIPSNTSKTGKPAALKLGIEEAKGEIILTTDADCTVSNNWIQTMVSHFTENVVIVAGPIVELGNGTLLGNLEKVEILGLITVEAGLIGANRPMNCMGANLAYRRDTFFIVGGFGSLETANDDELLMSRIYERKIGKIDFAWDYSAVVRTISNNSLKSFFRQRLRWATKGHIKNKSILLELLSLYLFALSVIVCILLIPYQINILLPVALVLFGKIIVDLFTLRLGSKLWNQPISIFYFLVAELLHLPYILITGALGQLISIRWKDRTINT